MRAVLGRRFVFLLVASLAAMTPAFAQPAPAPSAADNDRARALGHEGLELYNKGNWAEARVKFAEAERLVHSPVFVLYLARSARSSGDLAAAKEAYERLAKEVLPSGSPAPWVSAVESGQNELKELGKRLAPPGATASAAPSGESAPTTPLPTAALQTATLPTATAGPTAAPAVTSAAISSAAKAASAGPPGPAPDGREPGPLAPGLAALGLGAVGIGVGIGTFVHAKSLADDVNQKCISDSNCSDSDLVNKQPAIDFANGATAAFIAGGVAIAAGVVLLIARPGGKPAAAKSALRVEAGPASIRVSGSF
jgi:hypothetical protein